MAIQPNVACKALVKIDTGTSNALENLGYSINGINIDEQAFREDIFSDQGGGNSGMPVDVMMHGERHIITLDMVYWDPAVGAKIQYVRGTTAGEAASPCTLMMGDSKFYRLLITGTGFTRNYLRAFAVSRSLGQIGTHPSILRLSFEAYPVTQIDPSSPPTNNNVVWNTTTT